MYPLCSCATTLSRRRHKSSSTNTIIERSRLIPLQNLSETLSKIGHPHRHPRQLGEGIKSKQRNTRQKPARVWRENDTYRKLNSTKIINWGGKNDWETMKTMFDSDENSNFYARFDSHHANDRRKQIKIVIIRVGSVS